MTDFPTILFDLIQNTYSVQFFEPASAELFVLGPVLRPSLTCTLQQTPFLSTTISFPLEFPLISGKFPQNLQIFQEIGPKFFKYLPRGGNNTVEQKIPQKFQNIAGF